jgi:short-chain Z-isoprenyl diphosphate synthase
MIDLSRRASRRGAYSPDVEPLRREGTRVDWLAPLYRLYAHHLAESLDHSRLPHHVGVILDGHRRYARAEGLDGYGASYRSGMAKLEELIAWCTDIEIPVVTAWVLSTDNLQRPTVELDPYFEVLIELLDRIPERASALDFSFRVIGSLDLLPADLATAAKRAEERVGPGRFSVNLALGYGGRQEVVDACRSLVAEFVDQGTSPESIAEKIDVEGIAAHLYIGDVPDPDLVIRTSGESRLSGFLLWQAAYAECAFVDPYWPAFRRVDFLRALRDYTRRTRRFGK